MSKLDPKTFVTHNGAKVWSRISILISLKIQQTWTLTFFFSLQQQNEKGKAGCFSEWNSAAICSADKISIRKVEK